MRDPAPDLERPAAPSAASVPTLAVDHVARWFGNVVAVNDISFELGPGLTGLLGPNGAGKSTLLHLLAGLLAPSAGAVRIAGEPAWGNPATYRRLGLVPEREAVHDYLTGREFVLLNARLQSLPDPAAAVARTLATVDLEAAADRPIGTYSKGMRQRIKLAAALIHDPQLLVLDEPLSGIDPIGRREFLDLFTSLADQGKCLLVSSHELEELEKLTDHVAIMARGRIAAVGTLARIRDLLDDHPMAVRIDSDSPRALAGQLLALDDVVGVEVGEGDSIIVQARNPRRFFRAVTRLALEDDVTIHHLEPLDDSAHAILGYLLGGSRR